MSERDKNWPTRAEAATRADIEEACSCCGGAVRLGFTCSCGKAEKHDAKYLVWAKGGVLLFQCPVCGECGLAIRIAAPTHGERTVRTAPRHRRVRSRPDDAPPTIPDVFLQS